MLDYFRKLDMFGQSISFEENESKTLKTPQGAILSLIIIIATAIISFLFGQDIYLRTNAITRNSQIFNSNSTVRVNDLPFIFGFSDPLGIPLNNPLDYFDVYYEVYSFDQNMLTTYKKNKIKSECNSTAFPPEYKDYIKSTPCDLMKGCFCIDQKDDAFFKNKYDTANSQFIKVVFYPCNPAKRTCASDMNKYLKNFLAIAGLVNSYINPEDYYNPVNYYMNIVNYQFSDLLFKRIFISISNNFFFSDDGILLQSVREIPYFQTYNAYSEVIAYTQGVTPLGAFTLTSEFISNSTFRSYTKVQDLMAKIGGFFNGLYVIFYAFSYHYFWFLYIKKIYVISSKIENSPSILNTNDLSQINRTSKTIMKNNFLPNKETKNEKQEIQNNPLAKAKVIQDFPISKQISKLKDVEKF